MAKAFVAMFIARVTFEVVADAWYIMNNVYIRIDGPCETTRRTLVALRASLRRSFAASFSVLTASTRVCEAGNYNQCFIEMNCDTSTARLSALAHLVDLHNDRRRCNATRLRELPRFLGRLASRTSF